MLKLEIFEALANILENVTVCLKYFFRLYQEVRLRLRHSYSCFKDQTIVLLVPSILSDQILGFYEIAK